MAMTASLVVECVGIGRPCHGGSVHECEFSHKPEGKAVSIVNLSDVRDAKAPKEEHLAGEAKCHACGHRWSAVAPIGTTWLECPACESVKGLMVGACCPPEGGYLWRCNCGSDVFYIVPAAVRCCMCGAQQANY